MLLLLSKDRYSIIFLLHLPRINGPVAEWLGSGLQNHLQRFESARDLKGESSYKLGVKTF